MIQFQYWKLFFSKINFSTWPIYFKNYLNWNDLSKVNYLDNTLCSFKAIIINRLLYKLNIWKPIYKNIGSAERERDTFLDRKKSHTIRDSRYVHKTCIALSHILLLYLFTHSSSSISLPSFLFFCLSIPCHSLPVFLSLSLTLSLSLSQLYFTKQ